MMKDRNNKSLLVAIDEFRKWNVEPGDLNWDTLMFFFEDACREFALDKFYEQGFSDPEAQEMVDSPKGQEYFEEYLAMYLRD